MSGQLTDKFFAYIQRAGKGLIELGEVQARLGISAKQEQNLLAYLVRKKVILPLRRGVYLVPDKVPVAGYWQPNEYYTVKKYMEVSKAHYFIGGEIAIYHHGFRQQIPNLFTVYNDKVSGVKIIGELRIRCIKCNIKKIKYYDSLEIPYKKEEVNLASKARVLFDSINDWHRYNTLPQVYEWIRSNLDNDELIKSLVKITIELGKKNTMRRLGYFLEKENAKEIIIKPLAKKLKKSHQDWVVLDPKKGFTGSTNKKWGVIDNVEQ